MYAERMLSSWRFIKRIQYLVDILRSPIRVGGVTSAAETNRICPIKRIKRDLLFASLLTLTSIQTTQLQLEPLFNPICFARNADMAAELRHIRLKA